VIRASLERTGQPIGANDLLIAAHALTLGHAVVTDNEREFLRIDDLRVENWLGDDDRAATPLAAAMLLHGLDLELISDRFVQRLPICKRTPISPVSSSVK
jgi:hypothetical protein